MIDTLVITGSGLNFIQLISVIKILEENNIMNNSKNIYTSSGSSIIAFMIGLGLKSKDMELILTTYDF